MMETQASLFSLTECSGFQHDDAFDFCWREKAVTLSGDTLPMFAVVIKPFAVWDCHIGLMIFKTQY